jgi:predicted glycoside hydrolase/deacetylase ChbG (UPF0249 family)
MSTKSLIICADDYGSSDGTSEIIRLLLARGQINATTCLVLTSCFARNAETLRALARENKAISVGLHLDMSRVSPLGVYMQMPLPLLAIEAFFSAKPADEDRIFALFRRQWDEFITHFGRAPDFIDGHRFVHLLPPVRRALFRLIRETGFRGWVRQCRPSRGSHTPAALMLDVLSGPFIRDAVFHNVPTNPGFGGTRRFRRGEDLQKFWQAEMNAMRLGGVLVVHPGIQTDDDRLAQFRSEEAHALANADIAAMMERANLRFPFTSVVPWMRTYADAPPRGTRIVPQAAE